MKKVTASALSVLSIVLFIFGGQLQGLSLVLGMSAAITWVDIYYKQI